MPLFTKHVLNLLPLMVVIAFNKLSNVVYGYKNDYWSFLRTTITTYIAVFLTLLTDNCILSSTHFQTSRFASIHDRFTFLLSDMAHQFSVPYCPNNARSKNTTLKLAILLIIISSKTNNILNIQHINVLSTSVIKD